MSDADEILAVLNRRIAALQNCDAIAANAVLDRNLVAFEVAGPLQLSSAEAIDSALTQEWLDSFEDGPNVTMDELTIHADGSVAFCHSLNRLRGRRKDGHAVDVTLRSTLGLSKQDGAWKIVHGHTSIPAK